MRPRTRTPITFLTLLVFLIFPMTEVIGDELDELKQSYVEITAEYQKFLSIRDNPDQYEPNTVRDAEEQIGKLLPLLANLEQEITDSGGEVPRLTEIGAGPGDNVTATDEESGESVAKVPDSESAPRRRDDNPCDRYPKFERPATSAYVLPPLDQQSGANRRLARALADAESDLVKHLTICEREWPRQAALEWNSQRESLIGQILEIETQYAVAFAYPTYTDEENALLERAYQDSPQLRGLVLSEQQLFESYMELKVLADALVAKFRLAPDAATRLALFDAQFKQKAARDKWWTASNQITSIRGPVIDLWKEVQAARRERGRRQMREFHPLSEFEFHNTRDYISTSTSILEKLLGNTGIDILKAESDRRALGAAQRQ